MTLIKEFLNYFKPKKLTDAQKKSLKYHDKVLAKIEQHIRNGKNVPPHWIQVMGDHKDCNICIPSKAKVFDFIIDIQELFRVKFKICN